jgi:exodeoxyribonuclease V alpha subunit
MDIEDQPGHRELTIDFAGKQINYDFSELDEVADAVSVHKSEGSEDPAVILLVMTRHYLLLQRNLINTGITKVKKLVVSVGSKKALTIAIATKKTPQLRFTHLCRRLMR